jgi:hypothetical protein
MYVCISANHLAEKIYASLGMFVFVSQENSPKHICSGRKSIYNLTSQAKAQSKMCASQQKQSGMFASQENQFRNGFP